MEKSTSISLAKPVTENNGEGPDKWPVARMENVSVDIHSYGDVVQTYDYDNCDEQNNRTIT
eukprot:4533874-Heterocapsa_arctica.AAC.1